MSNRRSVKQKSDFNIKLKRERKKKKIIGAVLILLGSIAIIIDGKYISERGRLVYLKPVNLTSAHKTNFANLKENDLKDYESIFKAIDPPKILYRPISVSYGEWVRMQQDLYDDPNPLKGFVYKNKFYNPRIESPPFTELVVMSDYLLIVPIMGMIVIGLVFFINGLKRVRGGYSNFLHEADLFLN